MGGFATVASMTEGLIADLKITVPVALHLDHGSTFESCKAAIDAGFSSIMIDGSEHPIKKNIEVTKQVVEYAKKVGVSVEAEVGTVGGEEDGVVGGISYANPEECAQLIKETKVDFLAASLGSVHGHYAGEPKLGFAEMKVISEANNIPLVLHGGSGIPNDMIKKAIENGQAKINVNTEIQVRFTKATAIYFEEKKHESGKGYDPRKVLANGYQAIKDTVKDRMTVFGSIGKA
jgi:fructose-bisphosphate aldolase class II/6-phospho-5-dehydro-2-deoxy-D-gluconate aldolase